jgi:phosphoribosylamine--glycine ligase
VVEPTINGLKKQKLNYRGFVFFGLIVVNNDPFVIEYNVRMGDPETEVVIPRLAESLSQLIIDAKNGQLTNRIAAANPAFATTVFAVSGGYPEDYDKDKVITINDASETLFHAGTKMVGDALLTSGGRVLAATCYGATMREALNASYEEIESITFEGKYYRKDIGNDLEKFIK